MSIIYLFLFEIFLFFREFLETDFLANSTDVAFREERTEFGPYNSSAISCCSASQKPLSVHMDKRTNTLASHKLSVEFVPSKLKSKD